MYYSDPSHIELHVTSDKHTYIYTYIYLCMNICFTEHVVGNYCSIHEYESLKYYNRDYKLSLKRVFQSVR